jgi:hypothetical protein
MEPFEMATGVGKFRLVVAIAILRQIKI